MKKLFIMIRQGNLNEVKRIIERKPDEVNCVSGSSPKKDHGQSPLQIAFKTGNFEIAGYLINHGADINFMESEDEDTGLRAPVLFDAINAVIMSLCYKDFNASELAFIYVERLVREGADVNQTASNGWNAIEWTITRAEQIIERPTVYTESQDAVRRQCAKILDMLIQNGADYIAWANKEQYPGITNKALYIDDFVPKNENDIDRHRGMRNFMQNYFLGRNLHT